MSVLAHVVVGGPQSSEPAATQALNYILNSCPSLARSFVGLLPAATIEFDPGRVEAEMTFADDVRPDLTIHDSEGRLRVFVENKFWAPLTAAQPVAYLNGLSADPPSALVFVVPARRVSTVWHELRQRCGEENLEWTDAPNSGSVKSACVDGKAMMIVSWRDVLDTLLNAAPSSGNDAVKNDIRQLQGLVERMDSRAFLPLRADEVADQKTARRLINCIGLIDDIVGQLKQAGIADTKGLRPSNSSYYSGRYLHIHADGRFESWLGVDLPAWRDEAISPVWWAFKTATGVGRDDFMAIPELRDAVALRDRWLYIPIRLKTGVERERVVSEAVSQMKDIADQVLKTVSKRKQVRS